MKIIRKLIERFRKPKKSAKIKYLLIGIILGLLVLALLLIGTISWGVYKLGWQGEFIDQVLSIVPLPAAKVNSTYILYPNYLEALRAARKFYAKQKEQNLPNMPSDEELQKIVLEDRMIENFLVAEIAKKYQIKLSSEEIDAKMKEIIENKGSQAEVEIFLRDYYDLDLAGYQRIFVEPNLLYDKANEAVIDDEILNGQGKNKIQEALNKLRNGEQFEEVAKNFSDDPNAADNASEEGFVRGELPKDIEDLLFNLKVGEYTDVITLSNFYAIIKLEKKDENKGAIGVKKILVKIINIEDLIKEQKEKAQIKIYAY